jgi:glutathione S-transferase
MIELYFAPGACSFVPHVALEAIRLATGEGFEPRLIKIHRGEHRTPEYLAINPEGQVPTLVVDGRALTQIVAICDFLDRRHPQLGFLPREDWARTQALSMLLWMNNTAHPTFTRVFMPGKFARSESAIAEVREVGLERYREILARLDSIAAAMPGPYWFGEQVSVLDAYALSLLRWGTLGGLDAAAFPAYKAYIERLALAPPVAAAIERERLQLFVAPR